MSNSHLSKLLDLLWLSVFVLAIVIGRSYPQIFLVLVAGWVGAQIVARGLNTLMDLLGFKKLPPSPEEQEEDDSEQE